MFRFRFLHNRRCRRRRRAGLGTYACGHAESESSATCSTLERLELCTPGNSLWKAHHGYMQDGIELPSGSGERVYTFDFVVIVWAND